MNESRSQAAVSKMLPAADSDRQNATCAVYTNKQSATILGRNAASFGAGEVDAIVDLWGN